MNARVDHLVIVADTLEQGSQWCETTLGAAPVDGGRHALMGTHNRLLAIGGDRFPDTYLEIIAIDRSAARRARPRWFAMDDPALRAAARAAPRLVHAVARTLDDRDGALGVDQLRPRSRRADRGRARHAGRHC